GYRSPLPSPALRWRWVPVGREIAGLMGGHDGEGVGDPALLECQLHLAAQYLFRLSERENGHPACQAQNRQGQETGVWCFHFFVVRLPLGLARDERRDRPN